MEVTTRNSDFAQIFLVLVMNHIIESSKNTWVKVKNRPNLKQGRKNMLNLSTPFRIKSLPVSSSKWSQLYGNFESKIEWCRQRVQGEFILKSSMFSTAVLCLPWPIQKHLVSTALWLKEVTIWILYLKVWREIGFKIMSPRSPRRRLNHCTILVFRELQNLKTVS